MGKDTNGKTAYDHAIDECTKSRYSFEEEKFIKVINFLLPLCPNRAGPNLKNEKGETALHRASYRGQLEIVKHLMANGADQKLKDNNGKTAYDHAMCGGIESDWWDENSMKLMYHLLP